MAVRAPSSAGPLHLAAARRDALCEVDALTAEVARLRRVQFAARSEKMSPEQRALFDEAIETDIAAVEAELETLRSPAAR
ncbi:MAG: transposase domain-containing protein [Panacagrimonas sp.]